MTARQERRKNRRLFIDKPVQLATGAGFFAFLKTGSKIEGRIVDASTTGFRFISREKLPASCCVRVWLQVQPGAHLITIKLTGDVQWSHPHGDEGEHEAGIKLRPKPAKDMSHWVSTMHEHLRRQES